MLYVYILLLTTGYTYASYIETWPFSLADKYVEEFKSRNEKLVEIAKTHTHEYPIDTRFKDIRYHEEETLKRKLTLSKTKKKLNKPNFQKPNTLIL